MKKILCFLSVCFLSIYANFAVANFVAGQDYVVLDRPVKTITGDKVEVRELFWYYCPHCFTLEPMMENWLKALPSSAQFIRQPAVFSDRWINGAIFYYVLEQLNEVNRLHGALFDEIHLHKTPLTDQEDFVNWLVDNGIDKKHANDAFKSFSVRIKLNKSKINTVKYKTSGVPTFVVNGKYWVDSKHAGGEKRLFKVLDYLIQKESQ
ncbi:thiol:disulfide interchange protein DsbA/DsbL [Candidatus Thioglobus sp.]|jgi:DSBA-like thioredoxin domain.|uniref:thiol:disulfide interchange protein DsbA/DsbL n=1 Tax=Candidatus Thioglobus sp. TaxID=2026721 RepID=UPI003241F72D